jgi:serine/threonine protein kinase
VALYRDPPLRSVLPDLLHADDNAHGTVRSKGGSYKVPPFMVLERGITLRVWRVRPRNFFEVSTMLDSVARLLATLHNSGRLHRDLKPDNVLYLMQTTEWRLLDLGIAAPTGVRRAAAHQPASILPCLCSGFAPPRVLPRLFHTSSAAGIYVTQCVLLLSAAHNHRPWPWLPARG